MAKPFWDIYQIANYELVGYWPSNNEIPHHFATNANGSPVTITVSFDGLSTTIEQNLARLALQEWQDVCNVTFVLVHGSAQINYTDVGSGLVAATTPQINGSGFTTSATVDISTAWTNKYLAWDMGAGLDNYALQTFIHETGHALGLGHTGPYNGTATTDQRLFTNDTWQYSVMSYFEESNFGGGSDDYAITPQSADIAAVELLYGAPTGIRTGDTVYGFGSTAGSLYDFSNYPYAPAMTLYDGGGNNTLNCSGYLVNQTIDLNPGDFSSIGGEVNNITISALCPELGAGFNRAIGGSGNDIIIANALADVLTGGKGADKFLLNGQNATLPGAQPSLGIITDYDQGNTGSYQASEGDQIDVSGLVSYWYGQGLGGPAGWFVRLVSSGQNAILQTSSGPGYGFTSVEQLDNVGLGETVNVILDEALPAGTAIPVSAAVVDRVTSTYALITLAAGATDYITLNMIGANVLVSGAPRLLLNDGGSAIYDATDSSPTQLVFKYTVAKGDNGHSLGVSGIDLNGGSVHDAAGHSADLSGAVGAIFPFTSVDTARPTVTAVTEETQGSALILVQMSELVNTNTSGGVPSLSLNNGGIGTYLFTSTSGMGAYSVLYFTTPAQGNDVASLAITRVNLNGATVIDNAGNTADFTGAVTTSPINNLPKMVVASTHLDAPRSQAITLASLFSVFDPNSAGYSKVELWDTNGTAETGQFVVNGIAQSGGHEIDVSPADVANTVFQVGSLGGTDTIWIQLQQNGGQLSGWQKLTITAPLDSAPTIAVADKFSSVEVIPASSLFVASDPNGDSITQYAFWVEGTGGGHFVLDGVDQGINQEIDISASQLAQLVYQLGSAADTVWVRAFDGHLWSPWSSSFQVAPIVDAGPVETVSNLSATNGQSFQLSALFTYSDPIGHAAVKYDVWDTGTGGGHFILDGSPLPANQDNIVSALPSGEGGGGQLTYQAGAGTDTLWVRAYDGTAWGPWSIAFTVTVPMPTVSVHDDLTATRGQQIALSGLVTVADPGAVGYQQLELWDLNGTLTGGQFMINGAAQTGGHEIDVLPADIANTLFDVGTSGGTDTLWARILQHDGTLTAWQEFHVNAPVDQAPAVTASDFMASHNQNIAASSLFSVTDPDGDAITKFQLWDSTSDAASGHWVVNGGTQGTNQAIDVTSSQLASTTFQSGSGSDDLWVRAFDGAVWSSWKEFHVNAPVDQAPVVTASDFMASHNQNIAASSLFTVTDPDSDTITHYQFWDSTADSASGHFVVGGVAQGTQQSIDVSAAQLASATFQSGSGSDDLWVRAFDGTVWSSWKEFHVNAPVDRAPVVVASNFSATPNQSAAASALFSVTDPDGDAITKLQLWDSTSDAASGHWVVNGGTQGTNQAIDVSAAQLASTTFQGGTASDDLWVRANDGNSWSAWQEFHWLLT
ncbi:M10 family metallopeptidase [Bradyrhizobium erythrophlei]|uniref:Peptidase M10 serralysin C terminal n=1 Tax=Bradyrhizobium erythrophlei TaxID=1437360 RepID=A0A1H4X2T9_9BRAD|nr:M10 family metallopeptidase [Bradyrhizobium erythrophlei]SEC99889.1 Peptidase M10 serralysin C terminal [Bradyrhizobium erythrophlei]